MLVGDLNLTADLSDYIHIHDINNISFLKAYSTQPTNLCAMVYATPRMDKVLRLANGVPSETTGTYVVFDSGNPDDVDFIEAFLANNLDGTVENDDGLPSEDEHQAQWMKPVDLSGFGVEYNNAPVTLHFVDWLLSKPDLSGWVRTFNKSTSFYLKYAWYYEGENGKHFSDSYSQVVPTQTEQTAPRPSMQTASKAQSEWNVVTCNWRDDLEDFSYEAYEVLPGVVSILSEGVGYQRRRIFLRDYSPGREYRIKFASNSAVAIPTHVQLYGDGILVETSNTLDLEVGKTYFISIQAEMVSLLAKS